MFKKILIFCLLSLPINNFVFANIEIKARTAILQDFLSGEILFEKLTIESNPKKLKPDNIRHLRIPYQNLPKNMRLLNLFLSGGLCKSY